MNPIERIRRGSTELISEKELEKKLSSGKPLRIKLGVDPTSPKLHLGHTVLLRKLRTFQDLGHTIVFLIGDFTAKIGDPSGRDSTRPVLSDEDIVQNSKTYKTQALKVLSDKNIEFVWNSKWLSALGAEGILKLARHHTVSRMLERDDFSKRHKAGSPITIVEFLYPLLQGYDSVAVQADVELGGNDQKFNLLMGRELQRDMNQDPQVILTMPLLEGTDGVRKMSKSYSNEIALDDAPSEMFGKIMSISDETMMKYYELLTEHDLAKIKSQHPKEAKMALAHELTAQYHGTGAADKARDDFEKRFSKKEILEDVETFAPESSVSTLSGLIVASGLASGKNEAMRLLRGGGVAVDGQRIEKDGPLPSNRPFILQVGKRRVKKILA